MYRGGSGIGTVRVQPPELLRRATNRTERPAVRRHIGERSSSGLFVTRVTAFFAMSYR